LAEAPAKSLGGAIRGFRGSSGALREAREAGQYGGGQRRSNSKSLQFHNRMYTLDLDMENAIISPCCIGDRLGIPATVERFVDRPAAGKASFPNVARQSGKIVKDFRHGRRRPRRTRMRPCHHRVPSMRRP
jgi:hypothetical protein